MRTLIVRCLVVFLSLTYVTFANCQDLAGEWTLKIQNRQQQLITTLKIRFAESKADSCMGGEWRQVQVLSSNSTDKTFFPMSDPLSYTLENNQLIIGRNNICDAYLGLKASLDNAKMNGTYYALSKGGTSNLGYFVLIKDIPINR